jgi:LemA protein
MKNKSLLIIIGLAILLIVPAACNYNRFVNREESVSTAWGYVQSAYQRRADLIPNLVSTVQGAANFEKSTLTQVMDARAEASKITLSADQLSEENLAKFQEAQTKLSSGIGRLLAVAENYPTLQAVQGFRDLMVSLDETENRIKAERDKYNTAVKDYNVAVRRFPGNIFAGIFGFEKKAAFQADAGADKAPKVDFNKP